LFFILPGKITCCLRKRERKRRKVVELKDGGVSEKEDEN